jgi:3-phenylpropionate/trans-cinnamate dioxygenase ferredoxin reductase component
VERIVVVGASLAGLRAAEALRRGGFTGTLTLIGAEDHLPYDRPPLSKQVLAGEWDVDRVWLRRPDDYEPLGLDLRLGQRATDLDVQEREVLLHGGDVVPYDGVIVATGADPRRLPGCPQLDGVVELRTLDDALALQKAFDQQPRVVVVGAGFIGSEVAATARERGLEVTVLEALPVPLSRGLGDRMGTACAGLHLDHGVDLRCGVGVSGFEGEGRVSGVRLTDGSVVPADVVVVGVGVTPATSWLESSGLELNDGVVCDELCRAAPAVYVAGDAARWTNPRFGESMRVEHWTNAAEQGQAAAENLLAGEGRGTPFAPVPYFWSDQYDVKIQFVGRARPGDDVEVVDGNLESHRFVALYGRAGRLVGCLGFSRPRLVMTYRRLLAEGASWDEALALQV